MKYLPENKTARGFLVPAYIILPVYVFVFFLIPDGRLITLIMFGAIYFYLVIYGFVTDKRGKENRVIQKNLSHH